MCCGLRSTSEDLVQLDVVLAIHFLWPHSHYSRSIRKSSWNWNCCIIPLWQFLQNIASVLFAVFIRQYSSVITNITSVPCLYSYSHIVGLHADIRQCCLLLNSYTFPGWVPVSLYHNVTACFPDLWLITSMISVQMRHECWTAREVFHTA